MTISINNSTIYSTIYWRFKYLKSVNIEAANITGMRYRKQTKQNKNKKQFSRVYSRWLTYFPLFFFSFFATFRHHPILNIFHGFEGNMGGKIRYLEKKEAMNCILTEQVKMTEGKEGDNRSFGLLICRQNISKDTEYRTKDTHTPSPAMQHLIRKQQINTYNMPIPI